MAVAQRIASEVRAAPIKIRTFSTEAAHRVLRPERFNKFDTLTTRTGQILALCFLPALIIVSLAIITACHAILADVFGVSDYGNQADIAGFIVTGTTLAMVILAIWTWFQFVRTAAFGQFTWD